MSNYIVFVLIRYLRVFKGFDFVIKLVGFNAPLNLLNSMISIIHKPSRGILLNYESLSYIVPSLTKYL